MNITEIHKAHGGGTINVQGAEVTSEADYLSKVTVEGVARIPWATLVASVNKTNNNNSILLQIAAKEAQAVRAMRELSREREFPGDLTAQEKAFAQNRIRALDQDIAALRAQLQP